MTSSPTAQQVAFQLYHRIFYELKLVTGQWEADGSGIAKEIATTIAQQVTQERERCARIAENYEEHDIVAHEGLTCSKIAAATPRPTP